MENADFDPAKVVTGDVEGKIHVYLSINGALMPESSPVNKGRLLAKTASYLPVFGRLLSSHFTVNLGKKLNIRKRSNKNNCETFVLNRLVEIKAHFRSFKRVYLSHA